ncbi:unnamed protein product [Parascedosporium putredinis]|uniref:NmrA-like domain-containing protein n=1 Tax=Parascedosporium putredinis TaxID=1442378 RepID=A0A9P1H2J8_9PEZI|nr:unnamed protein product [Parascedosporium putredinis]CAI7993651.1 unnamed protein product [Parascedosporium putredinis]
MSKLFVVFGATGQQGGSLVDYLLNNPTFSKQYKADLSKPETLPAAVEGADVVFSVTNYWDTASGEAEEAQGNAVADAARAAGVSQFIWSSLPSIAKDSNGRVTDVDHFESKARVEEYTKTLGFPFTAFFHAGWYMQNAKSAGLPPVTPLPDGTAIFPFAWPDELELPYIDITDIGKYLAPALRDPEGWNGKRIYGATAIYTCKEIADTMTRVTGRKVRYATLAELPPSTGSWPEENVLRPSPFMLQGSFFGKNGPAELKSLHAQMDEAPTTWEEYVKKSSPWF